MRDLRTIQRLNDEATLQLANIETDFDAERRYNEAALLGKISKADFGRIEPFKKQTIN